MEVFGLVLNHTELLAPIMQDMKDAGFRGATAVDCTGMLRELDGNVDVNAPMMGLLRHFHSPERSQCKLLFAVIQEEDRPRLLEIVNKRTGGLEQVEAGVAFGVPLEFIGGVRK